jgi:hypothetical protein
MPVILDWYYDCAFTYKNLRQNHQPLQRKSPRKNLRKKNGLKR